jgi:hypothetical protein
LLALVEVLLDPYYRSIEGFIQLMSKEFNYFSGCIGNPNINYNDDHIVFFFFIHCVWAILQRNMESFEFNEKYVSHITQSQLYYNVLMI